MVKHELNLRNYKVLTRRYIASVKKHGWVGSVRGDVIGLWSPGHTFPLRLFTAGQTTHAFYLALEHAPDNINVQLSVKDGIQQVIAFLESTPIAVIRWARDYFNQFHDGAAVTFLELLEESLIEASEWRVFFNKLGDRSLRRRWQEQ